MAIRTGRLPRKRCAFGRVSNPDTRCPSKLSQLKISVAPKREVSIPDVSALAHGVVLRVARSITLTDDGLDDDVNAIARRCASGARRTAMTLAPAGDAIVDMAR